jgi:dihydrofolate reductase
MARLIYSAIASADGYVEDAAGSFGWAVPDEELHCFVNDLERPVGTYLYGRRMYQTMLYWETVLTVPGQPPSVRGFTGIWQAAEKIVFSKTLQTVPGARTGSNRTSIPTWSRRRRQTSAAQRCALGSGTTGHAAVRKRTSRSAGPGRPGHHDQTRSNRSRFITLFQAATKSLTNFSFASSLA